MTNDKQPSAPSMSIECAREFLSSWKETYRIILQELVIAFKNKEEWSKKLDTVENRVFWEKQVNKNARYLEEEFLPKLLESASLLAASEQREKDYKKVMDGHNCTPDLCVGCDIAKSLLPNPKPQNDN